MCAVRPFVFSVVILAAGRSTRMGQPKMLLRWRETSVVGHLIGTWKELGAEQVAVVRAADDEAMEAELDRLRFPKEDRIINHRAQEGMFSSVKCAAKWSGWSKSTTHSVIALGDQPHLQRGTLEALVDFTRARPAKICQPGIGGHGLHPVILSREYFQKLAETSAETLKDFLQLMADNVELMETDDAGADLDIDSPEDYEKAKRWQGDATGTGHQQCV
jgi:molybdenum cofactor cytidylyltransferase